MRRLGIKLAILVLTTNTMWVVGTAQARFRLVGPFGGSLRTLQRAVDASRLPQPNVTVTVWPLADLGRASSDGGGDFWGQRPFLIALGVHPSADELFHELGHVVDDGWQTPGQRCAFERVFLFSPHGWFFSDGSDAVSDNWAEAYALASVHGRRAPRSLVEPWTGIAGWDWPHLYGWVRGVANRSTRSPAAAEIAQSTTYCG